MQQDENSMLRNTCIEALLCLQDDSASKVADDHAPKGDIDSDQDEEVEVVKKPAWVDDDDKQIKYACMYVFMYVCMNVCMYVCIYVCMYVYMCVCMDLNLYKCR